MSEIIRAIAVSIIAAALAITIKRDNPAFSLVITVTAALFALYSAIKPLRDITDELFTVAEMAGISPGIISAVLKCVAIGIISKLGADILRDSGMGAVASAAELLGVAAGLWVTLPLINEVISIVRRGI